jgi:hypothetical protein
MVALDIAPVDRDRAQLEESFISAQIVVYFFSP